MKKIASILFQIHLHDFQLSEWHFWISYRHGLRTEWRRGHSSKFDPWGPSGYSLSDTGSRRERSKPSKGSCSRRNTCRTNLRPLLERYLKPLKSHRLETRALLKAQKPFIYPRQSWFPRFYLLHGVVFLVEWLQVITARKGCCSLHEFLQIISSLRFGCCRRHTRQSCLIDRFPIQTNYVHYKESHQTGRNSFSSKQISDWRKTLILIGLQHCLLVQISEPSKLKKTLQNHL